MGRNGAGKTTLLRALAGLRARVARSDWEASPNAGDASRYRDIAFVPQDPGASLYKERLDREIDDVLQGTGRTAIVSDALARLGASDLRGAAIRATSASANGSARRCAR